MTKLEPFMIERDAKRIALWLHLRRDLELPVKVLYEDDKYHFYAEHNGKAVNIIIEDYQLEMSLDDLNEIKIIPALKELLPDDLKFIHLDCT